MLLWVNLRISRPSKRPPEAHPPDRVQRPRSWWLLLITLGFLASQRGAGVERATLWVDTVKRGPLLREERGISTLVPGHPLDSATTRAGRTDPAPPGTAVCSRRRHLELVNPQLDRELRMRS